MQGIAGSYRETYIFIIFEIAETDAFKFFFGPGFVAEALSYLGSSCGYRNGGFEFEGEFI